MRLLFDEQLSSRLPRALSDIYPDSLHVESLGLVGADDRAVWQAAIDHGCLLVSKDEDFHRLSVLHGAPPKVVCCASETARLRTSSTCFENTSMT